MKRWSFLVLILCSAAAFGLTVTSCGGGGGSSNTVSVSATVGTSYNVAFKPTWKDRLFALVTGTPVLAGAPMVDTVFAMLIDPNGYPQPTLSASADIASDGSFSLTLDSSSQYVLLLVDTTALKEDRVAGYVTIGSGEDSMVVFPADQARGDTDMGTLEEAGRREARSSNTVEDLQANFAFTLAELQDIARSDDAYRNVINAYMNYDEAAGTTYHTLQNGGGWMYPLSSIVGAFPDPADYTGNDSFGFTINTGDQTLPFADICGMAVTVTLVPPQGSGLLDRVNDAMVIDTSGPVARCYDSDFSVSDGTTNFFYQWSGFPSVVPGTWYLRYSDLGQAIADTVLAVLDMADISGFDGSGNATVFVPVPRLNVDGGGMLASVDIQWKRYNGSGGYDPVNPSAVDALARNLFFEIWGESPAPDFSSRNDSAPVSQDHLTVLASELGHSWLVSDTGTSDETITRVNGVKIQYEIAGVNYSFNFEYP